MSESEGQRNESPLLSERGVTTISNTVVSQLAGMAAQEVEGVHMGGGATRTASGVLGSITGSEGKTSGISVEVGRTETAIDLKMGVEYNKNILQTVEEVRRRITDRVESLTGLRIKELNATITDITFPEREQRRRIGSGSTTSTGEEGTEATAADTTPGDTTATETAPEAQTAPESEPETTSVEPMSRTHTEGSSGPVPEEEDHVEERPLKEDEITELRPEEQRTDEAPEVSEEAQETSAETETTQEVGAEAETFEESETRPDLETETPEVRMRRRAEERARRRRRSAGDS
jgi:uncharacterized alkaline shock family protein YloU